MQTTLNSRIKTMSSESYEEPSSSAIVDSVFEKVPVPKDVDSTVHSDSSLAIVDLDEIGTIDHLVSIEGNLSSFSSDWPFDRIGQQKTSDSELQNPSVSSIKQDSGNLRSNPLSFDSPAALANVVQSTPIAGKKVESGADPRGAGDCIPMEDLCSQQSCSGKSEKQDNKQGLNQNTFVCEPKVADNTYNITSEKKSDSKTSVGSSAPICTQEEVNEQAREKIQRLSVHSAKSSASEASKDGSVASSAKVENKKETKKTERKPLSALNKTTAFRGKPTVTSQSNKHVNRLLAPRMNAAALSRIKARSPQKQSRDINTVNNFSAPKPSSGISSSTRKPPVKKQTVPSKRPLAARTIPNSSKPAAPKRKVEGPPKEAAGRSVKVDVAPKSTLASSRPSSAASTRSNSNIRRPQASTLSHHRAANVPAGDARVSLIKRPSRIKAKDLPKSRSTTLSDGKRKESRTFQCAVAMATLLDHVVNKLDGLSAPRLSSDNEQLQQLVSEQKTSNGKLSSRVDDLEKWLSESRAAHEREVTQLKAANEAMKKDLHEKLENINAQLLKQDTDHANTLERLQAEHHKATEDLSAQHEEEIAQLRFEWSEERAEIERDTQELRDSFNARVESKVEELIQPYINSYEENKSLRTVLEMKNSEQHKLNLELSQQKEQLEEVHNLRDHLSLLKQRNEDLQMQVEERHSEQRELRNDNAEMKRELLEKQRLNESLQQRVDELRYRLSTSTPSPVSSFNPVFTESPSAADFGSSNDHSFGLKTPVREKYGKMSMRNLSATDVPRENGTA